MTAERYFVKRPTGKVFGPFDKNAINMMLKSNKLGWDAELSRDKESWTAISEMPEFSQDLPQAVVSDLPRPVSGPSDLPRPVGAGPPALPNDLPRPVSGHSDLPRPVTAGFSDLPAPAGSNLPRPAGMPNLPTPAGSNLPRPAGANLPTPASNLPTAASNLPTAASNLPQNAGPANLPQNSLGSVLGGDIPMTQPPAFSRGPDASAETDLFGGPASGPSSAEEDLFGAPPSAASEEDLFGAPMSQAADNAADLFNAPVGGASEEDLFGAPMSHASDNGADLFQEPVGQVAQDDLFGGPSEPADDLFGGPAGGGADPGLDEDSLFGSPSAGGAMSEADLFGAPASGGSDPGDSLFSGNSVDDDDFLGGDQGFSFLDNNPSALDAKQSLGGGGDSWGDDLLGGGGGGAPSGGSKPVSADAWEDDLLSGNAAPMMEPHARRVDLDALEPGRDVGAAPGDSHDPFRPASSGIKPPSETPAQETAEEAAAEEQKYSQIARIAIPVVAILIVGGLGYGISKALEDDGGGPVKPTGPTKFDIDLKKVRTASYARLKDFMTRAKKAKKTPALDAKVMLVESIYLSQYEDKDVAKAAGAHAKKKFKAGSVGAVGAAGYKGVTGDREGGRTELLKLQDAGGDAGFYASILLGATNVLELESMKPAKTDDAEEKKEEAKDAPEGADMSADMAAPEPEPEVDPREELAKQALASLDAATKIDATLPGYWKGRLFETQGKGKKAVGAYESSLKASEDHIASLVRLGRLHYKRGDLNEASKRLSRVNKELSAKASNQERGSALHYMGLVHSARSQSELAIANFTKALQFDTSRSDTLRVLAEEYERAQKYKEALNFFKTNKSLGKKDPDVMLGIVRAHMGLKEWKQAIAQLEVGEKSFPSDARFPFYLGQLNMRRGTFYEAQKALGRAVEIDPKLLLAHATLAQLAWRTEKDAARGEKHVAKVVEYPKLINARVASEVAEFYRMAENRELATRWYRSSIEKDTNYWPARLALSRLLLEQGETQNALKLLERSRDEGVTDIRLSAYLADAYRQSKMYDRAIDEINKVIEKFPKNPDYIFIRGRIYFDRGNYDTALGDFNKAYELNPRYHEAYFYVGRTALEQKKPKKALKIFRHVLDYQPNNGEFRYYMGQVLESEGRSQQALEEYRKVTEVDPGYGVRNPRVYISRGRMLSRLGYSNEGKKDIARALKLAPEMNEALIAMGEADFRDKAYENAITHFVKALNKNPKVPDAQYKLGMAYVYLEQSKNGALHLQESLRYGYEDVNVYKTLGYLYKELGQRAKAKEAFKAFWEKTVDKDIPKQTRKEILRQLKDLGG